MDDEQERALKQQVRNQERRTFLNAMPMTLTQATALIEALDVRLSSEVCHHTYRLTGEWCNQQGLDPAVVISWGREHGGYCDCEMLANVAQPIEDAG